MALNSLLFKEEFPDRGENAGPLKAAYLATPLGEMLAIADAQALHLLSFMDSRGVGRSVERLCRRTGSIIGRGLTEVITSLEEELAAYFDGALRAFKTPLKFAGTLFQQQAWAALLSIPYGETRSYLAQAAAVGTPTAYRAVANANGVNQFAIVVPCHRIINHNGNLGGYGGGLHRKKWLLAHERKGWGRE